MTSVDLYEQTCHGVVQYRVMRTDGRLIFDRIQTDFGTEEDAVNAIRGEFRRKKLGPVRIQFHHLCYQTGRNKPTFSKEYDDAS